MSAPNALEGYNKTILRWLQQAYTEGQAALRDEPALATFQKCMDWVSGQQEPKRIQELSRTVDNRLKKIVLETVSALTDVRPIWSYRTFDKSQYSQQADILSKLARAWWKNNAIDRKLQAVLTYAACGGSAYGVLAYDEQMKDFTLIPYEPRDVIPIGPTYTDSIQEWEGVILRQKLPIQQVKRMFPSKAHLISSNRGSWINAGSRWTDIKNGGMNLVSSVWNVLTQGTAKAQLEGPQTTELLRVYVKDDSIHTGDEPHVVGDPDEAWSYTVYPLGSIHPDGHVVDEEEAKLYPRGRLLIATATELLYDGPNPNWHGLFPVIRFTLDPLPWSILGSSMIAGLLPLQNSLNEWLRGLEDGMAKWITRDIFADRNAISPAELNALNSRRSGLKAFVNPTAGEGFKFMPGPEFPAWFMQMGEYFKSEMEELSGVRGLQQISQLRQMPSADTLEQYMDALSPLLRLRARSIEISLGELAEMVKVNFFQYYDSERRVEILGKDGITLEDFDFDPNTLVPSSIEGATREQRAQRHHKNFKFSVAPNSFLNVSHTTHRMMILQLMRSNLVDPYTAWDAFDFPNTGEAPAETIPERLAAARREGLIPGPTPEMVQAQQALALAQAQSALQQLAVQTQQMAIQGALGPQPPQSPEMGEIRTNGVGPEGGRPPTGEKPPQFVTKEGGSRVVVSESGR